MYVHAVCSKINKIFLTFYIFAGKTTLADCLVASNGIISNRLAGKVSVYVFKIHT